MSSKAETPTWKGPFHRREIPRGTYGEISKIEEERLEAIDAVEQDQVVMLIVELADLIGAINGFVQDRYGRDVSSFWVGAGASHAPAPEEDPIRVLEWIGAELRAIERSPAGVGGRISGCLEAICSLARPYNLGFAELNRFAELRSRVARYALANAGS